MMEDLRSYLKRRLGALTRGHQTPPESRVPTEAPESDEWPQDEYPDSQEEPIDPFEADELMPPQPPRGSDAPPVPPFGRPWSELSASEMYVVLKASLVAAMRRSFAVVRPGESLDSLRTRQREQEERDE